MKKDNALTMLRNVTETCQCSNANNLLFVVSQTFAGCDLWQEIPSVSAASSKQHMGQIVGPEYDMVVKRLDSSQIA